VAGARRYARTRPTRDPRTLEARTHARTRAYTHPKRARADRARLEAWWPRRPARSLTSGRAGSSAARASAPAPLHCTMCCVATWCAALQHGVLHCNMVCCVATWCAALQHGVLRCNMVCCVVLHCDGYLRCVGAQRQGPTDRCGSHGGGRRCESQGCTKLARRRSHWPRAHTRTRTHTHTHMRARAHARAQTCAVCRARWHTVDRSLSMRSSAFCVRHGGGKRCEYERCSKSAVGATLYAARTAAAVPSAYSLARVLFACVFACLCVSLLA
jgi:hypothetical protein